MAFRELLLWEEHGIGQNLIYLFLCIALVMFAGCMSGLTLGLLSMDRVELEVLMRSGSPKEAVYAAKLLPLINNAHWLLVTLLVCNAAAMEALPIFLNQLVDEAAAIIISVTAILIFGEIIPQATCVRYGLRIGAAMAWPVRFLMALTAPVSWPLSKILDRVLGGEHGSLFRRIQLKALVDIHGQHEGLGGKLSADEISVIKGALDLTSKTAYNAMTPLNKVFMLSTEDKLDDITIKNIMATKPYSRLPVYRGHNRRDVVGLLLVKELLQIVRENQEVLVKDLQLRPLPRLSAVTPMYDMLKLFRTGRSHMAVLVQPDDPLAQTNTESSLSLTAKQGHAGPLTVVVQDPDAYARTGTETATTSLSLTPKPNENSSTSIDMVRMETGTTSVLIGPADGTTADDSENASKVAGTPVKQASGDSSNNDQDKSVKFATEDAGAPANGGQDWPGKRNKVVRWLQTMTKSINRQTSLPFSSDGEDEPEMPEIPQIAQPGEAIGIITIEDAIEELMQQEILDEMDIYVDNEQTIKVNQEAIEASLPPHLQKGIYIKAVHLKQLVSGGASTSNLIARLSSGQALPPNLGRVSTNANANIKNT